jgi:hypothetical protein
MTIDLDRITHPLRLASGSHQPGSGKGCAMNVISYIIGDTKITDYPKCSAPPLARLVQALNDSLASPDGFLSPENSVLVLDLGWRTVGTADTTRAVACRWMADLLTHPQHGVVRYASEKREITAIHEVSELLVRESTGDRVSVEEWRAAREACAAGGVIARASFRAAADITAADIAASWCATYASNRIEFTTWAINHWRDLAGLNTAEISHDAVNDALQQMRAADESQVSLSPVLS